MTRATHRASQLWSLALGAAAAAQGAWLVYLGRLSGAAAAQCLILAAALGLLVQQAWVHRGALNHRVDMLLVMLALGGLGMIVGWWIDFGCTAAPEWLRAGAMAPRPWRFWDKVWSWMTGLMLVGGIVPSLLITRCARLARRSRRRFVTTHIVGNVAMVAGMIWWNRLYGRAIGRLLGSYVVGAHLAMLVGMGVGMAAGMWLGEALVGLAPWRETPVPLDEP
jgi:hypothetical protein